MTCLYACASNSSPKCFFLCFSSSLTIKYWGSDLWFLVFSVFTQFLDNVIVFISHLFLLTCKFILRPPLFWPPCLCIHGLCCLWRATKSLTNVSWSSFHAVHLHSVAFYVGQHDPANSGQQPWSHSDFFHFVSYIICSPGTKAWGSTFTWPLLSAAISHNGLGLDYHNASCLVFLVPLFSSVIFLKIMTFILIFI